MFLNVDNSLDTRRAAAGAALVTPDDLGDLTRGPAACTLFIGNTGGGSTIRVLTQDGDDVTFTCSAGNVIFPVQVTRVFATGTDMTDIVALY